MMIICDWREKAMCKISFDEIDAIIESAIQKERQYQRQYEKDNPSDKTTQNIFIERYSAMWLVRNQIKEYIERNIGE